MAYIYDDSSVLKHQTPLFIQQANNTEVFCGVTADLLNAVSQKMRVPGEGGSTEENDDEKLPRSEETRDERIIAAIKTKSKDYCNEEEAANSLQAFVDAIDGFNWNGLINGLYNIEAKQQSNYEGFTGLKNVAEWLSKSEEQYFAKVTYSEEEYEAREKVETEDIPGGAHGRLMASIMGTKKRIEYKPVTRYRNVTDSIQLTATAPCSSIVINLIPKEEILS